MIELKSENIPKHILSNMFYIAYYSFQATIVWCLIIFSLSSFGEVKIPSDEVFLIVSLTFGVITGYIVNFFVKPIEIKIIKRNIFVLGLIHVLKKHNTISFKEIVTKYGFLVFQNEKVKLTNFEWASYIEVLIVLEIIELTNYDTLYKKGDDFNYEYFRNILEKAEFKLVSKEANIEDLIKKLDSYLL